MLLRVLMRVGHFIAPLTLFSVLAAETAMSSTRGPLNQACPAGAIQLTPGVNIQAAVERAGVGARFCLKSGVHRLQAIRPMQGQRFYGEPGAVLNGSRQINSFVHEGRFWVASGQWQHGEKQGECLKSSPACNRPEGVFMDDKPLAHVLSKNEVTQGRFYLDYGQGKLFLADDPKGKIVEITVAAFAFESNAPGVHIRNLVVEKYASVAQRGAIQARHATGWVVENCEVRLNSGGGIGVGTGTRVQSCNIHHNGQMGVTGVGNDVLIEDNRIWANNIYGFDFRWEAGGVKLALSTGVVMRGNDVHDNFGAGLWCDIDCHNVIYERNTVENNDESGIWHEISFDAIIRDNVLRHNGKGYRIWFWGADILVAASQNVEVYGNTITSSAGACAIMLIDQGRTRKGGGEYKTRDNVVHDNDLHFDGSACAGGASDTLPGDENFSIISDGNNVFDHNIYRLGQIEGPTRFAWGHDEYDWDGFRAHGAEPHGTQVVY